MQIYDTNVFMLVRSEQDRLKLHADLDNLVDWADPVFLSLLSFFFFFNRFYFILFHFPDVLPADLLPFSATHQNTNNGLPVNLECSEEEGEEDT